MFSAQSPRPLRGGESADSGRELRRENKVTARAKAKRRETVSARKKREEQERLDAAEEADYRRVWEQGNEHFYKGKYQEAAAHYTEAMKKNPNESAVFGNRAQCHIFLGALPEGLEDAEKCIELDPTYLMGYVCKAKVQALMKNYEAARETYIEGLKCDPTNNAVIDGFKRCTACIQRCKGGDVGPEDLNDILRDWHSDITLCIELKKNMEEVANILLDANFVSKLSDFGISHPQVQPKSKSTKKPLEDTTYMDPEYLASGKMTPLSDVYSFGIIVLRLLTGKSSVGIKKIVEDAMKQGDLDSVVDTSAGEWPDVHHIYQLADLALSCTEKSSRSRPVLSGQLWTALEIMRDSAMSSSPSSSSLVRAECSTPSHFMCAISQEIMKDPHIAADGFTYEGDSIRQWLKRNNTSPMTNLQLPNRGLIPNLGLRSAIQEWLQQNSRLLQTE